MAAGGEANEQATRETPDGSAHEGDETLGTALIRAGDEIPRVARRIGVRFARAEARQRAPVYLHGLLSPIERKNGWQLAEAVGDPTPYAMQHLVDRADWDAAAVRDDLRAYVTQQLGDPAAVLVVDETGFVKKGTKSAGVAKQYTGTLGKIEKCQGGVFLAYARPAGVAFLDRARYLPQEWTADAARCRAAHIPEAVGFATKPELARVLLERARGAGVPAAGVTADSVYGDSVYGDDRRLRMWWEAQEQPYVLAVSGKEYVTVAATWTQRRVSLLLGEVAQQPAEAWQRLSAGAGTTGPRLDDWLRLPLVPPLPEGYARAGFWCGAATAIRRTSRATWPLPQQARRWSSWCAWRAAAGQLRSPSRRPRARWGSPSMRCAAPTAGLAISRSPCSLRRC